MTANTDTQIETDSKLASAVRRATEILERVAGNTVLRATADWKSAADPVLGPVVDLNLSEQGGGRTIGSVLTQGVAKARSAGEAAPPPVGGLASNRIPQANGKGKAPGPTARGRLIVAKTNTETIRELEKQMAMLLERTDNL